MILFLHVHIYCNLCHINDIKYNEDYLSLRRLLGRKRKIKKDSLSQ